MVKLNSESASITLREATLSDEPFLFEVYASTRMAELDAVGWNENQKLTFIKMQFVARERSYAQADNRIILLNGRAIGRLLVNRSEASILLSDIALLTEYRNAGIGTSLIQDLINEATDSKKILKLHVLQTSPAVRLYERLGFSCTGFEAAYLEMSWAPLSTST